MSAVTFAPVIYKQYRKKDGTYPVRFRVIFNRQSKIISTNLIARPEQLNRKLAISDMSLLHDVSNLVARLQDAANKVDTYDPNLSIDDVVRQIERMMSRNTSFSLDFFEYGNKIADEKPKNSRVNYLCALHALENHLGVGSIDISLVTTSFLNRFEAYLRNTYGENARAVSMYMGAIAHIHRRAQKEFNNEESDEIYIKNPFAFYTPPKQKQSTVHRDVPLSMIQQMIKMRTELSGRERRAVDAFLLSFGLMGMNSPDLLSCRPPKNGVLVYYRQKTRDRRPDRAEMHVRIEPCIKPIFDEWADNDGEHAFIFHRFHENHKQFTWALAKGLRAYRDRMKIPDDELDFYSARHTWATTAYKVGVNDGVVNDCLCHIDQNMKVTNIYVKKDWSVMWKANAKVLKKLKWPNTSSSRPTR